MGKVTLTLTLPNGKRKYFRGDTREEAEAKREALRKQLDSGLDLSEDLTVAQFAEVWLREYKATEVRESTLITLRTQLRTCVLPYIGRLKVREVRPVHIRHMLAAQNKKAKSTLQNILTYTRAMFNMAVENDLTLKNPCLDSIKATGQESKKAVPLTPEQEDMLLDKARGTGLYLFVLLGLSAGLRRGELLGLQWNDIDLEEGTLTVRRTIAPTEESKGGTVCTTLKTEASHRVIPLPWSVVAELRKAKAASNSVFVISKKDGSFYSLRTLSNLWDDLTAELPFDVHPHLMRHTRITRWFEQGLDIKEVQYLAGHSTSRMTLEVYTHYQADVRILETAKKIRAAT